MQQLQRARDGFEVNDRSQRERLFIPLDLDDKQLIRELKRAGLLNPKCRFTSFSIDGDDLSLYVNAARTGEPLYQLELA